MTVYELLSYYNKEYIDMDKVDIKQPINYTDTDGEEKFTELLVYRGGIDKALTSETVKALKIEQFYIIGGAPSILVIKLPTAIKTETR